MWQRRNAGTYRVFITVKTYPQPSTKHNETVCTAGVTEDGRWIRLYPIPFRWLDDGRQYQKWQWIEVSITKDASNNDPRRESHRVDVLSIKPLEVIDSEHDKTWKKRRKIMDALPHHTIQELESAWTADRESKVPWTSMGIVRPTAILDMTWEEQEQREWTAEELAKLQQERIFGPEEGVQVLEKIPYRFYIHFRCADREKPYKMMFEDWEIGMLYRNCMRKCRDEQVALQEMKNSYLSNWFNLEKRDVRLIVGTRNVFPTWLVIGMFTPPRRADDGQQTIF
jgi:hypothetical protein